MGMVFPHLVEKLQIRYPSKKKERCFFPETKLLKWLPSSNGETAIFSGTFFFKFKGLQGDFVVKNLSNLRPSLGGTKNQELDATLQ